MKWVWGALSAVVHCALAQDGDYVNDETGEVNSKVGCIKIPLLKEICVGYSATTCTQVSARVNLTYGGEELLDEEISSSDQETCRDFGGCRECTSFKSVTLSPAHIKICPQTLITCSIGGFETDPTGPELECLEIGNDCDGPTSCRECTERDACGWCEESQSCVAELAGEPLCDTCQTGWLPRADECPMPQSTASIPFWETENGETNLPVVISMAILLPLVMCVIIATCTYCYKRQRRNTEGVPMSQRGQYSQPIELQEETEEYHPEELPTATPYTHHAQEEGPQPVVHV